MTFDEVFEFTVSSSRYVVAALAVLILGGCVFSLVTRQFGSRVGSYLVHKGSKKRYALLRWENALGRSPTCDLVFDVPTVSRFHAVISKRRTGWVIADTHSKTGVFVNGEKIEKTTLLNHGDSIRIGTVEFEFFDVDVDDMERQQELERRKKERAAARKRASEKPTSYIPALIDEAAEKAYLLGCESCVIGRSPECDVRLRYSAISAVHAKISRGNGGWVIEDMGSSKGTKVNARAISGRKRLKDGDVVGLGGIIFVFKENYKRKR